MFAGILVQNKGAQHWEFQPPPVTPIVLSMVKHLLLGTTAVAAQNPRGFPQQVSGQCHKPR